MCARSPRSGSVRGSALGVGPVSANGPCGVLSGCSAIVGTCGFRAGARLDAAARGSKRWREAIVPVRRPVLLSESVAEHVPRGPEAERIAAFRPARPGVWPPRESIEVRPVEAFADKLVEEQPGDAGAGKAVGMRIVGVGDVGLEPFGISLGQRQTPAFVVVRLA